MTTLLERERAEPVWNEIREVKPSELSSPADYYKLGLVDLVAKAYRLDDDSEANKLYFAMREYSARKGDEKKTNFMAFKDGKAIGSISIHKLFPDEPELGRFFWEYLKEENSVLYTKALSYPMACFVEGVVVHPDFRGFGIGKNLYSTLVEKLDPAFILGDTRTPQAVIARANSLAPIYRTFFGTHEVTPASPQNNISVHMPVLEAGLKTYQYSLENGIWYADISALPYEANPKIEVFPKYIQEAFEDVLEAQKKAGEGRTATKPLVSVKTNLLTSLKLAIF